MIEDIVNDISENTADSQEKLIAIMNNYINGEKLTKSISDFWKYREEVKKTVKKQYPKLLKQLSFLFLFLNDINEYVQMFYENLNEKDTINFKINACMKLYNKSLQMFIDSFSLFETGSVSTIWMVWRSIYENYVCTLYLINAPNEDSLLFNNCARIQESKLFNTKLPEIFIDEYKQKVGAHFNGDYSWATQIGEYKTFKKIVEYTREKKFYPFYLLSTYIGHSSSFSVNNAIAKQDDIPNTKMIGYFPDDTIKPLNTYLTLLLDYVKLILNAFTDKEHKELFERLLDYFSIEIDKNGRK